MGPSLVCQRMGIGYVKEVGSEAEGNFMLRTTLVTQRPMSVDLNFEDLEAMEALETRPEVSIFMETQTVPLRPPRFEDRAQVVKRPLYLEKVLLT